MSGIKDGTYVEGWILHLFGEYERTHIDDIPGLQIEVPIKVVNALTEEEKDFTLAADWVSVSKVN